MNTHVNLLPLGFRRRQLLATRLRAWAVIWTVAALAFGLAGWWCWTNSRAARDQLARLQRENAPVDDLKSEIVTMRAKLEAMQSRERATIRLADNRSMLTLLGRISQSAQACAGYVSVQQLRLEEKQQPPSGSKSDAASATHVVVLTGVGADQLAVAQFAANLRDAVIFRQVQLKSTGAVKLGDVDARAYTLECSF